MMGESKASVSKGCYQKHRIDPFFSFSQTINYMNRKSNSTRVWSSDGGRICSSCNKPKTACECWSQQSQKIDRSGDGIVRVSRETKGRKGKGVTIVSGLQMTEKELKVLAKELKKKCGSGGTVANGKIEIQGEHRDKLVDLLAKKGFTVKRVGG